MKDSDQTIEFIRKHTLKDWLVYEIEKTAEGYLVTAQYALPVWACPRCGVVNPRLWKRGTKEQTLRLPVLELQVRTIRQRYQCQHCGATFWEPLSYQTKN